MQLVSILRGEEVNGNGHRYCESTTGETLYPYKTDSPGVPFPWRWVAIEARFPVQGHEALSLEAPLETLYPVYS